MLHASPPCLGEAVIGLYGRPGGCIRRALWVVYLSEGVGQLEAQKSPTGGVV